MDGKKATTLNSRLFEHLRLFVVPSLNRPLNRVCIHICSQSGIIWYAPEIFRIQPNAKNCCNVLNGLSWERAWVSVWLCTRCCRCCFLCSLVWRTTEPSNRQASIIESIHIQIYAYGTESVAVWEKQESPSTYYIYIFVSCMNYNVMACEYQRRTHTLSSFTTQRFASFECCCFFCSSSSSPSSFFVCVLSLFLSPALFVWCVIFRSFVCYAAIFRRMLSIKFMYDLFDDEVTAQCQQSWQSVFVSVSIVQHTVRYYNSVAACSIYSFRLDLHFLPRLLLWQPHFIFIFVWLKFIVINCMCECVFGLYKIWLNDIKWWLVWWEECSRMKYM